MAVLCFRLRGVWRCFALFQINDGVESADSRGTLVNDGCFGDSVGRSDDLRLTLALRLGGYDSRGHMEFNY